MQTRSWHTKKLIQWKYSDAHFHTTFYGRLDPRPTNFRILTRKLLNSPVSPRMNFEQIGIPNNICIFKNDEYKCEYYLEFEKLFEYYSREIFDIYP